MRVILTVMNLKKATEVVATFNPRFAKKAWSYFCNTRSPRMRTRYVIDAPHCIVLWQALQDIKTVHQDKRLFTPSEVYTTLMKISDSDLHLLGLSDEYARPEWMILTVLPVPPPPVRPSIAVDGGTMRSEDDLTYKLGEIIKASTNVRKSEQEGSPAHIVTEYEQLLQVCAVVYSFVSLRH
jgi:DNA-directed RNA polymerase beta' subunit